MSVQGSKASVKDDGNKSILEVGDMESSDDMEEVYQNLIGELVNEVASGRKSESFEELMDVLAVAGSYSARNKFLIKVQDSEAVGPFNGYNQWIENFGRVPEKGSSALWVLAPKTVKYCESSDDPVKYCGECDNNCEDTKKVVVGYNSVPTFAYSQTVELPEEDKPKDVKDISVISEKSVSSEVEQDTLIGWYQGLIESYEENDFEVSEVSNVENWEISSSARGIFNHNDNSIKVRNFKICDKSESVDVAEKLSTLIHEVAHSYLKHGESDTSKARKEMEAEAVSYIVCRKLGIETESGVYISSHLQNEVEDLTDESEVYKVVQESVKRIGDVSGDIIEGIRTKE